MEFIASTKNIGITPRKVRLVSQMLKGLKATDALARLDFVAKAAARPLAQVIKSALANGKNLPAGRQAPELTIKNILVDEGIKMKRRDTSHGARYGGGVKTKRTSHIRVILTND